MATKQARELAPGDIVKGGGTLTRVEWRGAMLALVWASGTTTHARPWDVFNVTHANTIGGAL